jgi:hypothetical protein
MCVLFIFSDEEAEDVSYAIWSMEEIVNKAVLLGIFWE